jgi:ubiquinone biosynthesis protein COQ9
MALQQRENAFKPIKIRLAQEKSDLIQRFSQETSFDENFISYHHYFSVRC